MAHNVVQGNCTSAQFTLARIAIHICALDFTFLTKSLAYSHTKENPPPPPPETSVNTINNCKIVQTPVNEQKGMSPSIPSSFGWGGEAKGPFTQKPRNIKGFAGKIRLQICLNILCEWGPKFSGARWGGACQSLVRITIVIVTPTPPTPLGETAFQCQCFTTLHPPTPHVNQSRDREHVTARPLR